MTPAADRDATVGLDVERPDEALPDEPDAALPAGGAPAGPGGLDPAEHADFAEYVRVRGPHLAGVARLLVDDRATAEDLVQTVLVKALASWPRIRRSTDVDAYLRKALVNTRNSWWWRHRRELPSEELPDSPVADHGDDVAEQERLAAALGRLPRGQRTAVVLRYYADLSESQVAEAMGCSIGTVRSQTARGVAALRDAFGAPRAPGRLRGRGMR